MASKQPNLFLPSLTLGTLVAIAVVSIYGCNNSRLDPNPPRARLKVNGAADSKSPTANKHSASANSGTTLGNQIPPRNGTTLGDISKKIRGRGGTTTRSRSGTTLRSRSGTTLRSRSGTTSRGRTKTRSRSGTTTRN